MGVKLENKYIKNEIKAKYGEFEVYNPEFKREVYSKISQMIKDNSTLIKDNDISDIQINNIVSIFRIMLSHLTNIESEEYWNNMNDNQLEKTLDFSDGDFKKVVNTLMDIMIEIGHDNQIEESRKINILNNKLEEMVEAVKANIKIDKTLSKFGLDRDKLSKVELGDENAVKEFQQNIINELNKSKRGRPKKSNK
jgi:hypothetical protein